jgi:exonuclease SbcC
MIITSIKSHNLLKYTELNLENLPEKGIIAISGNNESGKSSIGESVCFALFGRTFSLEPEEMKKIVLWGEQNCSVNLNFKVETQEYSVYRYLDTDGNHSARLSLLGHDDAPLARSPQQVDAMLTNILGFTFEEFIESFYLAQREITSPHPHGTAVKSIAGVDALEQVSKGYERKAAKKREKLETLLTKNESLQGELDELALEEDYLEALEEEKNKMEADLGNTRELATDLQTTCNTYQVNEKKIKNTEKNRGRARFWRLLSLLLALATGGIWGLLMQKSELALSAILLEKLQQDIPGWQESYIHYIGITAALFAVMLLFFSIRSIVHQARLKALFKASSNLASVMARVRALEVYEKVQDSDEAEYDEQQQPVSLTVTQTVIPAENVACYDVNEYTSLLPAVESVIASASEVANYAEIEQTWLLGQISLRDQNLVNIKDEIDGEVQRVNQGAHLETEQSDLLSKTEELSTQLALKEKAIELLAGASQHFSNKFNHDIRDLMSRTLPLFTQGRYEHLQIEPELGVRVFSNDKRDFLDMEEISSGTQRQIMLALRLAMAQKLMGRGVKGRQFAFLDEPFAFFDEERTRHALSALDELSDAISQIWIVSQTFPEGHEFTAEIKCSRELGELSLVAPKAKKLIKKRVIKKVNKR